MVKFVATLLDLLLVEPFVNGREGLLVLDMDLPSVSLAVARGHTCKKGIFLLDKGFFR